MAEANLELARETFTAFERRDIERVKELMAEDIIIRRPHPDDATFHGHDGFFEAVADWTEGFRDWKADPLEFVEPTPDAVVVRVSQSALAGGSEVPVVSDFWFGYRFRGGRVSELGFYRSMDEAIEAVSPE